MAMLISVLRRHSARRAREFTKRLVDLACQTNTAARAASNFWVDHRPLASAWRLVVQAVTAAHRGGVEDAIRQTIRNHRLGLKGPKARIIASSLMFGRVISRNRLFSDLWTPSSSWSVRRNTNMAAFRSMLRSTLDQQRHQWQRRPLGRYMMWSTFGIGGAHPFDGIPDEADSFRAAFGLDHEDGPMIVFAYTLTPDVEPRFPTVLDAYGAATWPFYFQPAQRGARCGWTIPWDTSPIPPRPEVVHEVITGTSLAAPIRKVGL